MTEETTTAEAAPELVRVTEDDPRGPRFVNIEPDPALDALLRADTATVPAIITDAAAGFMPVPFEKIDAVAERLAKMAQGIPAPFRENVGACWAVAYQAARWGMDPVALIKMAYLADATKGTIGYMAQAIHAVVNRFAPIRGGMRFSYGYADPAKPSAANRFCRVEATDLRTGEVKHVTTPTVAQIKVKNSPLWFSDPDQQLAYYGGRAFARRHYPEVLMGVYSVDEVQQIEVRDVSKPRERPLFEEDDPEPVDAVFETIPPTDQDAAAFQRWEAKQEGKQDSRDPRDAPDNAEGPKNSRTAPKAPPAMETPPQGVNEPGDAAELREWAAQQQAAILALTDPEAVKTRWDALLKDETTGKRWKRLKAYQQAVANGVKSSVFAHVERLTQAKAAGADPETGEV